MKIYTLFQESRQNIAYETFMLINRYYVSFCAKPGEKHSGECSYNNEMHLSYYYYYSLGYSLEFIKQKRILCTS